MKYWKVTFSSDDQVLGCSEIPDAGDGTSIVVRAETQEQAIKLAFKEMRRLRTRQMRVKYLAEGRCICGNRRDRAKSDGSLYKQCVTCYNRQQKRQAKKNGDWAENEQLVPMPNIRIQGDRRCLTDPEKIDLTLQTLEAVKDQWLKCRNVGAFGKWLLGQIEDLKSQQTKVA